MKSIVIEKFGPRSELKLVEQPIPEPGAKELLIRVRAAGVNPVDYKIREGYLKELFPHAFPLTLGWDCAGYVERCGPGATKFKSGDEIYAYARKPKVQSGTYTEHMVLSEDNVALKPRNFTYEEAASVPLAALTAYQALKEEGNIAPGHTVLIHAAAGGVGTFAVQFAKEMGAKVVATASIKNHEYVRRLGADAIIDYNVVDFREAFRALYPDGADIVVDGVGGEVLHKSADIIKPSGRLVSIVRSPAEEATLHTKEYFRSLFVRPDGQQLSELTKWAERGQFKTSLAYVFPLEEASKAHEILETRHVRGKIVLRVS